MQFKMSNHPMQIAILCTDANHPVMPHLKMWKQQHEAEGHNVQLETDKKNLAPADILFLVSCSQIVGEDVKKHFGSTLVLHAADLPKGRGWSPHIWSILDGASEITLSLLEAADAVDSGDIWLKTTFKLEGHELLSEINQKLFDAELSLMSEAVKSQASISPKPQIGEPGPYLKKRTPDDSELDPDKSIKEQFNLLRIVDNQRYPAFFKLHGKRYILSITKDTDPETEQE